MALGEVVVYDNSEPDTEERGQYVQHYTKCARGYPQCSVQLLGGTHKMRRAVVRGVLKGCNMAAVFIRVVSDSRVSRPQEPDFTC